MVKKLLKIIVTPFRLDSTLIKTFYTSQTHSLLDHQKYRVGITLKIYLFSSHRKPFLDRSWPISFVAIFCCLSLKTCIVYNRKMDLIMLCGGTVESN